MMNKEMLELFKMVKNNYEIIEETYLLLEKTSELDLHVHLAGQWILDNMYVIEENYLSVMESKKHLKSIDLPTRKLKSFHKQINIYSIAEEYIESNKGVADKSSIIHYLKENQKVSYLTSKELHLFPLMLKMALIKFMTRICLNIYNSQLQKIKVEEILTSKIINKNEEKVQEYLFNKLKMFRDDPEISQKLKDTNTAFVEYLAFRLKEHGETTDKYYNILNNEAQKIGFTVEQAIVKEHMEIAKTSEYIGKAITTLKRVDSFNFREIFEKVNLIDETLAEDYTNEFKKCDYKTKTRYRNRIIKLAQRFKLSEKYVARKAVDCSHKYKKHVGVFLSGEQKYLLNKELGKSYLPEFIFNRIYKPAKPYLFVILVLLVAVLSSITIKNWIFPNLSGLYLVLYYSIGTFCFIEIADKLVSYLVRKLVPPKILPRLDFAKTIDPEYSTYIVMPTVISSYEKIDRMIEKMEVTYLANRSNNMYYMLLGDCIDSDQKQIDMDKKYFEYMKNRLDTLNEKYSSVHKIFNGIYRKRVYSKSENCYMGYERKRGALKHFNELVLEKLSQDEIKERMYLAYPDVSKTKYAITIDEDTELSLNTAKELVGIIAHPLNRPVLDKDGKTVKSGHALIQPAIGLNIEIANKTIFSKIFGGFGGIDIYTNAISNLYQDLFNEAIFCGKGIYDIELFEQLLSNEIPNNLVLSHDLLEGCYMRAGLASDIQVEDGFPNNYIAYMNRNHRWYRGDIQILKWLFSFKSPLNFLSKWKIFDNLRRPLLDVILLIGMLLTLLSPVPIFAPVVLLSFVIMNFGHLLGTVDSLIFGKNNYRKELLYIPLINGFSASFLTMTFQFITLPYRAYMATDAFTRSLYRMFISKKHLLEWKTGETLEKSSKDNFTYYVKSMLPNFLVSAIILVNITTVGIMSYDSIIKLCMVCSFCFGPMCAFLLGKSHLFQYKQTLNEKQKEEILEVGKRTWNFFDMMMTEVNNYLPTDNYQENRRYKIVNRTSSTNIGFGILAIIDAFDLKFISINQCMDKLINIMHTVEKLEKWNGHLFNWYNIKTLDPLKPRFVSTVDSGNFIACIYVLYEFLNKLDIKDENIIRMKMQCKELIQTINFNVLYSEDRNLFSIGYTQEENRLLDSYYDMLMSENRITSLIAIASKQITSKHWFALARNATKIDGYTGLISWSGTAFEYFLPYLFMKSYEYTLLDQSLFFANFCQKKYCKLNKVPFGISESAFEKKDDELNYQYQAFGIPWLGLKRGLKNYLVVAPYASLLTLEFEPNDVYRNMKKLKELGAYGSYGFYESIDFTKSHLVNDSYKVIKTYMSHHQGMILTSINNYLNSGIIKERFNNNPNISATKTLLQERENHKAFSKVERSKKIKIIENKKTNTYSPYVQNRRIDLKENITHKEMTIAILKSQHISEIITSRGNSYISYLGKTVNVQRFSDVTKSKNDIYLTDSKTGKVYNIMNVDQGLMDKSVQTNSYVMLNSITNSIFSKDLEITAVNVLSPNYDVEIKKVTLYNPTNCTKEIIINTYIEPALTDYMTSVVHPSFNNLQIETYYDQALDVLVANKRLKNENDTELYLYTKLIGIDMEKDVETEKTKLDKKQEAYDGTISSYPLWPVLSYRAKIYLNPYEVQTFYYITGVAESKYNITNTCMNMVKTEIEKSFRLSEELASVTARYLKLEESEAEKYNHLLKEILFDKKKKAQDNWNLDVNQSMLWKHSISGDIPILLVEINSIEKCTMIDRILRFNDYVKNRKLDLDIIVITSDDMYPEKTYEYVKNSVNRMSYMDYTKGNVFVFDKLSLSKQDLELFYFVAKKTSEKIDDFLPERIVKKQEIEQTEGVMEDE